VYGEDHATATRRSQCVSALKAAPPRKTKAVSPEDSQPQRVPHPRLFVEFVQADQLNRRVAHGPIGQLRVEMRRTVTSESRLLRVVPPSRQAGREPGAGARGDRDSCSCPTWLRRETAPGAGALARLVRRRPPSRRPGLESPLEP
jgi:hypothetical protein